MADIVSQSWFWPVVLVSIGLPVVLIVLTEVSNALARRASRAATIVVMVRNYLVPVAALFVLISQMPGLGGGDSWSKLIATMFWLLAIVVIINALNHLVFHRAEHGSWRDRFPTIFSDIIRFTFIIVGIAVVFWLVWGADVAGIFAALGVTSIIVGLALQNAVGSIISGLLLIFESPFSMGDWIEAGGARGQVVEVNWRAVHIDTGNGVLVIPTAELAANSFVNLTRGPDPHDAVRELEFGTDDPPGRVRQLLVDVARDLPLVSPDREPRAASLGGSRYRISIPLLKPGDREAVLDAFSTRVWYAARRAELHLDRDATDDWRTDANLLAALHKAAPLLHLRQADAEQLAAGARLERYCGGESLLQPGIVPDGTRFILDGRVTLGIESEAAGFVVIARLGENDAIGLTALTRNVTISRAMATGDVDVLYVPVTLLDEVVRSHPALARELVSEAENRVAQARTALAAVGEQLPFSRRVLG